MHKVSLEIGVMHVLYKIDTSPVERLKKYYRLAILETQLNI